MAFDVTGARAAGYSDVEIANHLAQEQKFDLAGARKAGYSDTEIIGHLAAAAAAPAAPAAVPNRQLAGVPGAPGEQLGNRNVGAPERVRSVGETITGTGEAALTLATGAVGGTAGLLGGTVKGLAGAVMDGTFGTQAGVRQVEQAAGEGMAALTYQPRTESGQEQAAAVGEGMAAVLPATAFTAEMGAVGRAASAAGAAARDLGGTAAAASVTRIRAAAPAIADRVQRTLSRNPDVAPTPGTRGSVGAAGTDMATLRRQVADDVGVDLTVGQATRDQTQLRFEQETAKSENGARLRERYSDQNERLMKHFDNLVDRTGKETPDLASTGRSVDAGLKAGLEYDKGRVRVAYKEAEKSAEGAAPVILEEAIQFLNESAPDAAVSPLLGAARQRAIRLGAAIEGPDGNLVPQPTTVKNAELLRRAIGNATDYEPTNIRNAALLKGAIDGATEPAIGPLYSSARRLRENLAKKYEDKGVVASLLNNKRGMADRKVAIADVFEHSILNASRESVSAVRRALTHGKEAPVEIRELGQQAWRDLQGETANWIKEQAFANTATDQRGNVILSVPKLDKAIKRLDGDGRLDAVFGKQGAQHMRDLNDLAKVIYTTPPGAVNHSNTASVLLAALAEAGVTGSMTGLPVPVLTTMRLLAKQVKNRQLQKRIEQALGRARAAPEPRPPAPPRTLH
jgi:hypothetical protein